MAFNTATSILQQYQLNVTASAISDGCIRVDVRIGAKANYPRKIYWKYKRATQSAYTTWETETVPANQTPSTYYRRNIGNVTQQRLVPNRAYDIRVEVVDTGGTHATKVKTLSMTTLPADGDISVTSKTIASIKAKIDNLKSTASYGRMIHWFLDEGRGFEEVGMTNIDAGEAAGSPSKTFTGGFSAGKTYRIRAELWWDDTLKYKTITKSVAIPYTGISVPGIDSIVQGTPPSADLTITWNIRGAHFVDNLESTTFAFYARRSDGTVLSLGSETWDDAQSYEPQEHEISLDGYAEENLSFYIVATAPNTTGSAKSEEYPFLFTRLFRWDAEKIAGEPVNMTASEWNRMVNYVNEAAELYPNYFIPIEDGLVETDDEITAGLFNKAYLGLVTKSLSYTFTSNMNRIYTNGFTESTSPYPVASGTAQAKLTIKLTGGRSIVKTLSVLESEYALSVPSGQADADVSGYDDVTEVVLALSYKTGDNAVPLVTHITARKVMSIETQLNEAMRDAISQ